MSILQTFLEALESLTANKMRSGLTVLGIIIGVAAVIAMMALGRGAQSTITGQINGIGSNLIFVTAGNQQEEVRNPKQLTLSDAQAIADPLSAPLVSGVAPYVSESLEVSTGKESERVSILGVTAAYAPVMNESVTEGEFFSEEQISGHSAVAVIGPDTAEKLLGRKEGVVGQNVRISGQPFRIVGVLKSKGGSSMGNQDNRIMVPLTTGQSRLFQRMNREGVSIIVAQAIDSDSVADATEQISEILRTRHRTQVGMDDFTIFTQESILSTVSQITGVLTLFLGGVAAISLLVGGIGIMNIMLVSVTERTREIGLRKAIGARKRDILVQFLTESILLSLVGGLIGIILAWMLSMGIAALATASGTPLTPEIGIDAILLATLFSMGVGLIFGIYPANRAANLQPVEALRFE
jgi:putative ABC transport system permease protein